MRPSLTRYRSALRWLLAALLMALAIYLLRSDPEALVRLLATPPRVLGGLALLVTLNQVLMSFRFSLAVSEAGGKGVSAATWFRLTSVGQFLNLFVPQLGNVYRGVALKREYGIAYMSYASGLFAFVWLDAVTGFVTALLVIAVLDPHLAFAGYPALLWLGAVIAVLIAAPFFAARIVRDFHLGEGLAGRIQARTHTLLATVNLAFKRPAFLLRFFAVNVLAAAGHVASLWLAFGAVGANVPNSGLILFQIFVKLSNLVAITPGNLGLTELAYAALAHASSCTAEQGVAVGLLMRSVGMVTVITLGLASGGGAILMRGRRGLMQEQPGESPVELGAEVKAESPLRNR
jgi:uncharacterized membrane protein YbhN (UPF0104 family)